MGIGGGPGVQDIGRVLGGQRGAIDLTAPVDQARFDPPRSVRKKGAGPDGVFLQIPAQLLGLDRTQGGNQRPGVGARDRRPLGVGRAVAQPGGGAGPGNARLDLPDAEISQFQNQRFERADLGWGHGETVGRRAPVQRDQDGVQRRFDAAGAAVEANKDGLVAECPTRSVGCTDHPRGQVPPGTRATRPEADALAGGAATSG